MDRREFMKVGMAAVVGISLPVVAGVPDGRIRFGKIGNVRFIESPENNWVDFDPGCRYANGLRIMVPPSDEVAEKMVASLYENMCLNVPPEYRGRVEIDEPVLIDFGHASQVSWTYTPVGG